MNGLTSEIVSALRAGRFGDRPEYCVLAIVVRGVITGRRLPAGTRLPSQRELAGAGSLARTTVASAYNLLRGEALIEARHGAGTWVRRDRP